MIYVYDLEVQNKQFSIPYQEDDRSYCSKFLNETSILS